jgi:hypothetical protein
MSGLARNKFSHSITTKSPRCRMRRELNFFLGMRALKKGEQIDGTNSKMIVSLR